MADPRASRDRDEPAGSMTARCLDGPAGADSLRWMRGVAALAALLVASTGCTPLDDAMVAIFGRSMRDSRSFDPYESPAPRPENSVPFSAGTRAPTPGAVNIGVPELGPYVPEIAQSDLNPPPGSDLVQNLPNPVEADGESLARVVRLCVPRACPARVFGARSRRCEQMTAISAGPHAALMVDA